MPTEKFFNLENGKRERIVDSMKKEFSRVPFHDASVNRIVEDAGISKGSFWVYFESKEEAIEYLIELHLEKERKKSKEIFQKNNGDLFESYVEIYDYLSKCKENKIEKNLKVNIFKSLIENEKMMISKKPGDDIIEAVKKIVDTKNLSLTSDDDLISLIKMLNFVMRTNLVEAAMKLASPEQARNRFVRQIEILKNGISKEMEEK